MLSITNSNIKFTSQPRIGPITDSWKHPENAGTMMSAQYDLATPMEAIGSVTFSGTGSGAGWTIGFMQAVSQVDWAVYRGQTPVEGSVLVQKGAQFGQGSRTCFDAQRSGTRFQRPIGMHTLLVGGMRSLPCAASLPSRSALPITLDVALQDQPRWFHVYLLTNRRTGAVNTLVEARAEVTLCAVLAAIDPTGRVHVLRGWFWTVLWQNKFDLNSGPPAVVLSLPIGSGNRCTVGPVFTGAPTDPRFATIFTELPRGICNIEQNRESFKTRLETTEWTSFNVPR